MVECFFGANCFACPRTCSGGGWNRTFSVSDENHRQ